MIHSMTMTERRKPDSIDFSRRRRVAQGSGVGAPTRLPTRYRRELQGQ